MILVENIVKTFDVKNAAPVRAVDGITLECKPGEIFGLLGPNGAGKTTLIRMLATILAPTSGSASVAGFDVVNQAQDVRQNIGYLTGSASLYERLTARETVRYFGSLYGLQANEVESRMNAIFAQLDMAEFADRRCDKLSTGQKQRVSIARAIIHKPPVMFFDEPTSGLDIMAARTVVKFIKQCRDEGRTVVFSTHIMSEVEALCDRIAIVYKGKLSAIGTIDELREQTGESRLDNVFLKSIGMEAE